MMVIMLWMMRMMHCQLIVILMFADMACVYENPPSFVEGYEVSGCIAVDGIRESQQYAQNDQNQIVYYHGWMVMVFHSLHCHHNQEQHYCHEWDQ